MPGAAPTALAHGCFGTRPSPWHVVADNRAHHLPERRAGDRLQLPMPAAALAGLDRGAGLGAIAVTVLAALDRLEGDLHLRTIRGLSQIDLDRHRHIAAGCRPPSAAPNGPPPPKNASNRSPIEPNASKLGA